MPLDVVNTLCDLVRLPSVNPMGRDDQGDTYLERRVTDYLQQVFQGLGVPWQRQTVSPGRDNILARFDGNRSPEDGGQIVVWEVHQDTVPVEGMTIAPWTPEVREGRVYGRGSCDIKGGMACMLTAFSRLVENRPGDCPTIVLACSVDEEYGFSGARRIAESWQQSDDFLPRLPDAVVVSEPTLLDVVVAHKGTVRWRCRTRGRAAHSSRPEAGHNAIYDMARVVTALETYAAEIVPTLAEDSLLGRPTLSVGLIDGGISVNVVPDGCAIEIDRRFLPSENQQQAWEHVCAYLAEQMPEGVVLEPAEPHQAVPAMDRTLNETLAWRVGEVARQCGGPGRSIGVPYGTDAPAFVAAGIPTVVFGPGDIAQAHTVDEWVSIDQLHAAAECYYRLAATWNRTQV